MNKTWIGYGLGGSIVLLLAVSSAEAGESPKGVEKAVAWLTPTEGNEASGSVVFTRAEDGVKVEASISGLTPGPHGFHVHQWGDCSAKDGTSAGGHFDPAGAKHGAPDAKERHVGDLGNLEADEAGAAVWSGTDPMLRLGGPRSIIGRAVILHAGADDLESQPSGAAGARVACGVVGVADPAKPE